MNRVLISCLSLAAAATHLFAAERPHILLVMTDDMGFSDLGCYGGEVGTPTLDRLAMDGLRFSQFYNTTKSERVNLTAAHPERSWNASRRNGIK